MKYESKCADCAGYDIEWMYRCGKHNLEYCRGCSCPECAEDSYDETDDGNEWDEAARERQDEAGAFNPKITGNTDANG